MQIILNLEPTRQNEHVVRIEFPDNLAYITTDTQLICMLKHYWLNAARISDNNQYHYYKVAFRERPTIAAFHNREIPEDIILNTLTIDVHEFLNAIAYIAYDYVEKYGEHPKKIYLGEDIYQYIHERLMPSYEIRINIKYFTELYLIPGLKKSFATGF